MALTVKDYKKILDIIDIAYSVPDRATMFRAVCERLEKLMGISSAVYMPWNADTRSFQFQGHVLYHAPPEPLFLFLTYYAPVHPVVAAGAHTTVSLNQGVKITDFVSARQYADNPYARECSSLTPHFYELCVSPSSQGDVIGGIGFHRKHHERDFSERDREIVNVLLPHLSRAMHTVEIMALITSAQPGGVIVVGAKGEPLIFNQEAQRALNGRPVSSIPDPGNGAEPAFFRTETGVYRVRTSPVRWSAREKIVFLEPQPPEKDLCANLRQYGLTQRQQEVAVAVIRGFSNREIAERLFICEQTVKDHLRDVFEQLHVHRRSELTAKVLGLDPGK
jgi:DNA-binding CsgD family transcriptional regulator